MSDMVRSFNDVFGHYIRTHTVHYIRKEEKGGNITLYHDLDWEEIKEPCNPWLMFFHIGQKKWMKPNTHEFKYQDEETERLWNMMVKGE